MRVEPEAGLDLDELHSRILAIPTGPAVPWFLDVDGVLNIEVVLASEDGGPVALGGWPTHRRVLVPTSRDPAVPFLWSPDLVDCLNLLVARGLVDIRWLTSWDADAPNCAAPAIGLAVGRHVATDDSAVPGSGWWKLRVVQRLAQAGQFCIWTDDYLHEGADGDPSWPPVAGNVLAICPLRLAACCRNTSP